MRIIISPAKKMRVDTDTLPWTDLPTFLEDAERLSDWVRGLSYAEQKQLWACSDKIAMQSSEQYAHMNLRGELTPALLAYDGIQYAYMAPTVFEDGHFEYVQEHLRILSGLYGILRPMDGVVPYRLEMQAKLTMPGYKSLYEYWGRRLYDEAMDESRILINLASGEYARVMKRYIGPKDRFVSVVFGELKGDRVVQKGVYVKMARGEMVRYLADAQADDPECMRDFRWSGYAFDEGRSTPLCYTFVR